MSLIRRLLFLLAFIAFAPAAFAAKSVLVLGDSLSAGFGIRQDAAWPALLQERLAERRFDYSVINASISGETTAGGRSRIAATLERQKPALLIVVLGANDGLRGLPLGEMRDNLVAIVTAAKRAKAKVLIVGMRLPPNYGPYADAFAQTFADVARKTKTPLVPFLLEGVAEHPELFQPDQLHPTAAAQSQLLDTVWRGLEPLLTKPAR